MTEQAEANPAIHAFLDVLRRQIASGVWPPGFRIPPERELSVQFNLSRNTLRRGLKILEDSGILLRQVGRGSFVAFRPTEEPAPSGPTLADFARGASPVEIMEVRLMIEPSAAALAAIRASAEDLRRLRHHLAEAESATGMNEFEHNDGRLHQGIVRAAKNTLLETIYCAINSARVQPEWRALKQRSLTPDQRAAYHRHHVGIINALSDRDADRARMLATDHLVEARRDLLG